MLHISSIVDHLSYLSNHAHPPRPRANTASFMKTKSQVHAWSYYISWIPTIHFLLLAHSLLLDIRAYTQHLCPPCHCICRDDLNRQKHAQKVFIEWIAKPWACLGILESKIHGTVIFVTVEFMNLTQVLYKQTPVALILILKEQLRLSQNLSFRCCRNHCTQV